MSFDIPSADRSRVTVALDIPPTPPPEVLDAIDVAAGAHERLAGACRELRFMLDDTTGELTVEMHDLQGDFLYTLPPSRALDIAGDESPA